MKHRTFENIDVETSLLGFGCMRFPTKDGKIDRERAEKMLDMAYKAGVTYYDTAYPYHNGESEKFLGEAMKKYPRGSFYFADKLPPWEVGSVEDAERIFNEQLKRLQTDYIDFYLIHALNKDRWHKMLEYGVVTFCEDLQRQGKIRHFGFSFHDNYDTFQEILTYRKWDFCQIQYNYMDINEQAGDKGYELAAMLDIPFVIMEPVKGGALASLPEEIMKIYNAVTPGKSAASWALRWVGSHKNVKVILSGMSAEEQVEDNIKTFEYFESLNPDESKAVDKVREAIKNRVRNGCTGCRYCMPCPQGVNIPRTFRIWNNYGMYENKGGTIWEWNKEFNEKEKPVNCVECGLCEDKCPQKISIREQLKQADNELSALK